MYASPAKTGAQSRNDRLLADARSYRRHLDWPPAFAGEVVKEGARNSPLRYPATTPSAATSSADSVIPNIMLSRSR